MTKYILIALSLSLPLSSARALEVLSEYDWMGCTTPLCINFGVKFLNEMPVSSVGDLRGTQEVRDENAVALVEEIKSWIRKEGEALGFDLSNRLPGTTYLHLFNPDDYAQILQSRHADPSSVAFRYGKLLLVEVNGGYAFRLPSTLQHELLHAASYGKFKIIEQDTRPTKVINSQLGFWEVANDDFLTFNEAFNELVNLRISGKYWKQSTSILSKPVDAPSRNVVAYLTQVCLVDAILEKLAKTSGQTYDEVFDLLEKDYFTGGTQEVKKIEEMMGKEDWGKLRGLLDDQPEDAIALAESQGIESAVLSKRNLLKTRNGIPAIPIQ